MTKFGYARVSTDDQDLTIQEAALLEAGCDIIRSEKKSGTTTDGRKELRTLMEFIREGDTLMVTRIDRLARSLLDLQTLVLELDQKGVSFVATEQPVNTATAAGKAFLSMLGVFAEFETRLRRERQLEGIKAAKAKGVYKGRKSTIDAAKISELREQGIGPAEIARRLGIGRATVYRILGNRQQSTTTSLAAGG